MPSLLYTSPLGLLLLEEDSGGLSRIDLVAPGTPIPSCEFGPTALLNEACLQLEAYFAGKLRCRSKR
jgi:hypothetical protein